MIELHKFYNKLIKNSEELSAILLAGMGILVLLQIILRVFGTGFGWPEELSRYMLVWMTMISAGLLIQENGDVRIELFVNKLPCKVAALLESINNILMSLFALTMVYFGWIRSEDGLEIQMVSLKLSMVWFYIAIPVGGLLILIHLIFRYLPKKEIE